MFSSPSIDNNNSIAFVYYDSLYTYNINSREFHYILSGYSITSTAISPNGNIIAFSATKGGKQELYIYMNNQVKRITYYAAQSVPISWKNNNILVFKTNYYSPYLSMFVYNLYQFDIKTGQITENDITNASFISYHKDQHILQTYGYGYRRFGKYKGGAASKIWFNNKIYMKDDIYNHERPYIIGNDIYYMSCKEHDIYGQLYKNDLKVTEHQYYIDHLSSNGKYLVYEAGGMIYTYYDSKSEKINININSYNYEIKRQINRSSDYFLNEDKTVNITTYGRICVKHPYEATEYTYKSDIMYRQSYSYKNKIYGIGYNENKKYIDIYHEYKLEKRIEIPSEYRILDMVINDDLVIATTQSYKLLSISLKDDKITILDESKYDSIKHLTICDHYIAYCKYITAFHYTLMLYDLKTDQKVQVTYNDCHEHSPQFISIKGYHYLIFLSGREHTASYDNSDFLDLVIDNKNYAFALHLSDNNPSLFNNVSNDIEESKDEININFDYIENRIEKFYFRDKSDISIINDIYSLVVTDNILLFYSKDTLYKYDFTSYKLNELCKGYLICANQKGDLLIKIENNLKILNINNIEDKVIQKLNKDIYLEWNEYKAARLLDAWRFQLDYCCFSRDKKWQEQWHKTLVHYSQLIMNAMSEIDIVRIIYEMYSHLRLSHAYIIPIYENTENIKSIGCEYTFNENNECVITKVYNTDQSDIDVSNDAQRLAFKKGDIIHSINGQKVDINNTVEKLSINKDILLIKVNDKEHYIHTCDIKNIRYRAWVNENRAYAHQYNIGYIHIPDMSEEGFAAFHRLYKLEKHYPNIIIDVRYNGGGNVSSQILRILQCNKILGYSISTHSTEKELYPHNVVEGKLYALTNEFCGSDGDIFTFSFKELNLGKVFGTRTTGITTGLCRYATTIDGVLRVTQPEFPSIFYKNGKEISIENYGAEPDIEIIMNPYNSDKQLEQVIEYINQYTEHGQ